MNQQKIEKGIPQMNEAFFRSVFENSTDAFLLLENKVFTDCNQAAVKMLNAGSREQVLSTHPSLLSPEFQPDGKPSAKKAEEMIQTAIRNGSHRFEWIHRRVTGEDFPVEVLLTSIQMGNKTIIHTVWREITERKKAEDELKRSINFTNALLDAIPTPVFYKDKEGRYQGCNRAFTEIMGKTAEEIRNKTVHQLWPSENADLYHQKDLELIHNPQHQVYEAATKDKDGNTRPVIFAKDVFFDEGGKVAGLVGSFLDITEQKQAQEILRTSEERYQAIFNASPVMFWLKDTKNNMVQINQAAAAFENVKAEEMAGRSSYDVYPREQAEAFYQDDLQVIQSGKPKLGIVEKHTSPGSGKTTWLETGKVPIRSNTGEITGVLAFAVDITEREKAAEELRRIQTTVETAPDFIAMATPDGTGVYINPAGLEMIGYTAEEFYAGMKIAAVQPDIPPEVFETVMREGIWRGESEFVKKNGSRFPISQAISAYKDKQGQVQQIITIAHDITEQKKAEELIRQSEERFRRFTEATIEGLVFHEQGKIIDVNPSAVTIFGYSDVQELVGRNLLEFIVPELHELVLQKMQSETVLPYEIQGIHKDGTIFPVETSTRVYTLGNHTIRASSIRDITDRKKAEEELLRLKNAIEQTGDGIALADLSGNVTYANPAWAEMHGYTPGEILGKSLSIFHTKEQLEQEVLPFNKAAMEVGFNSDEIGHVRKDGVTFPTLMTVAVQKDQNGAPVGLIGTARDITERKQVEQVLRENQQILQAVMDNIPQLIFWKDSNLIYLGCNQNFAKAAGVGSPAEIVGKSDYDLAWKKEEADAFRQDDMEVMSSGQPKYHIIEPQLQADGRQTWADTNKIPMLNAAGKIVGVLGTYEDITERKQAEANLQRRVEVETLLTTISSNFVTASVHNMDEQINQALELLGKFADTDRSYLFMIAENGLTMNNTHEWCAEGIESHINNLKGLPVDTFPWLMERLKKFEVVNVPLVAGLPAEAGAEKAEFQAEDIQSIIVVPIVYQNKLSGFMGFDAVSRQRAWEADTVTVLRTSGETFITTIERIRLQKEVEAAFERRGYQAQVITEISQEVAAATELNELFERVVNLTKERLGYYHTQLLRYDPVQDAVTLIRGYGETGQKMLEAGHKMPMGSGLIGTAAATGETLIRSTLTEDLTWQPNPLLPDTKGEIAVPIKWQDNVLGVLDVQSNEAGALTEDDRLLLESLCGQIAVAIHSTELLEELRTSRERYELSVAGSNDGLWDWDMVTNNIYFSPRWKEMIGYGEDELNNGFADFESLLHPDDHDRVLAYVNDYVTGKIPHYDTEFRFLHKDGSYRWIRARGVVVRNAAGVPLRMAGSHTDITEQRKAQEDMAERLEEINRLYRSMSHEGWKTYRATADLPAGFMFDQTGVKPLEDAIPAKDSFANVPMKVLGGEVVGNLAVADDPQRPMSQDDLQFLQQVSEQIALALESARLSAQTQSALAQTEKLSEAGLRFTRATDLQELVQIAVETLGITQINRAVLETFSYNSADEVVGMDVIANWWSGTGREPTAVNTHYTPESLPILKLFITPEPMFIANAFHDERIDEVSMQVVRLLNVHAVAVLPLFLADRQIGVLLLESEEIHEFNQDEIRVFSAMGPLISTVLENRRQFERARQQAEREGLLNVISQKIQSATSVEAVLQIAARELGHALGAPMTIAQLSMKDKK
jgi:PAS domain S-box-containing protein